MQTLEEKETWNKHFTTYIRDLDSNKPVIWAGDLNVAPTEKGMAYIVRLYSLFHVLCRFDACEKELEQNRRVY